MIVRRSARSGWLVRDIGQNCPQTGVPGATAGKCAVSSLAHNIAACHPSSLVWWIEQGFSPLSVVQRQLELFSEKVMPEFVG